MVCTFGEASFFPDFPVLQQRCSGYKTMILSWKKMPGALNSTAFVNNEDRRIQQLATEVTHAQSYSLCRQRPKKEVPMSKSSDIRSTIKLSNYYD